MCWEFFYLQCKTCGKVYYEGKDEILCGSSGFESANDGTMCGQCEEREYFYSLDRNLLVRCYDCRPIKIQGNPTFERITREEIMKLNGGTIPPREQTSGMLGVWMRDRQQERFR
jgi:hypothetical protein